MQTEKSVTMAEYLARVADAELYPVAKNVLIDAARGKTGAELYSLLVENRVIDADFISSHVDHSVHNKLYVETPASNSTLNAA